MKKSEYNILKSETNNLVSRNILRPMPTNFSLLGSYGENKIGIWMENIGVCVSFAR